MDNSQFAYFNQMAYFPPPPPPPPVPQLLQMQQVTYEAQSSRRNMSSPVEFINPRTSAKGIALHLVSAGHNVESLMVSPEDAVLNDNVGVKLSYRLQFEGQRPFAKQKYAKTTGREIPVSRVKMARQVAEVVQAYFEERGVVNDQDNLKYIQIGGPDNARYVRYDQVYLLHVDHVTSGSLQPCLAYEYRPPAPHITQTVAAPIHYQFQT